MKLEDLYKEATRRYAINDSMDIIKIESFIRGALIALDSNNKMMLIDEKSLIEGLEYINKSI